MFKRNLQRQLKQVEDDLDTQKRELTISELTVCRVTVRMTELFRVIL